MECLQNLESGCRFEDNFVEPSK